VILKKAVLSGVRVDTEPACHQFRDGESVTAR
jgi:hypothetical protein